MEAFLFWTCGALMLLGGVMMVLQRSAVVAALWLVFAFIAASGVFAVLAAPFLAIMQVLVYAGAIMVLFLFVIMMLDIDIKRLRQGFWRNMPLAATLGVLMVAEMVLILSTDYFGPVAFPGTQMSADYSNTRELGRLLFTDYVYPFELASIILLVAIIAAVVLTLRRRKDVKHLDPVQQVAVKHSDRLRVLQMPAEKEGE